MNRKYKKVDLHHKWIVRTPLGLLFLTPAQQARKYFGLKSLPAVTQQRELQDDWPDPLYKPITMALSLRTKTENDITRKVEGIGLGSWTVIEEVLGLLE